MSDVSKPGEPKDGAPRLAASPPASRGDDYDWGHSGLSDHRPAPPQQSRGIPGWAIVVMLVAGIAVALWFPVGLRMLQSLGTGQGTSGGAYQQWLQGSARSTVASQIAPAVKKLASCVEAKSPQCACKVSLPSPDRLEDQMTERSGEAAEYGAVQAALREVLSEYGYLRVVVAGACPAGGLDAISQAVDRYSTAHNRFVDAINAAQ